MLSHLAQYNAHAALQRRPDADRIKQPGPDPDRKKNPCRFGIAQRIDTRRNAWLCVLRGFRNFDPAFTGQENLYPAFTE
jgi:hypothetical protein